MERAYINLAVRVKKLVAGWHTLTPKFGGNV